MEARSALIAAVVDGDVSVARTWPALTAWPSWIATLPTSPEFAKFRLVTPLLLTVPVKDRASERTIRGTYQTATATTMAAIRMPPAICGVVTGRRLGSPASASASASACVAAGTAFASVVAAAASAAVAAGAPAVRSSSASPGASCPATSPRVATSWEWSRAWLGSVTWGLDVPVSGLPVRVMVLRLRFGSPHRTSPASARRDPTTGRPTRPICVPHFGRGQLAPWHYAPCAWPFGPALTAVPGRDRTKSPRTPSHSPPVRSIPDTGI